MDTRNNRILLGIIILLIAVVSLVQNFIDINYGGLPIIFIGLSLLMLYKTKRKSFALIIGVYCLYFGLISFVNFLGFEQLNSIILGSAFFIAPGIIFLTLYMTKNKLGLLLPGCMFLWFGSYLLLDHFKFIPSGSLFLLTMGIAFLIVYILGRNHISKMYLYLGGFFVGFSIIKIFFTNMFSFKSVPIILSILLIVFAFNLIFSKRKNNSQ